MAPSPKFPSVRLSAASHAVVRRIALDVSPIVGVPVSIVEVVEAALTIALQHRDVLISALTTPAEPAAAAEQAP